MTETTNLPSHYHAHVYFDLADLDATAQMQQHLIAAMPDAVVVHRMIARPIGPHPLPMFEVDFPAGLKPTVLAVLEQWRGARSVLIHPVTNDDLRAHTIEAQWLGPQLDLLLDRL